jgi:uncharacterized Zn-binding protein involved in type VI secretion
MPAFLTTASTVQCMHGGQAILTTSNTSLYADGMPVLLQSDTHSVAGCPFTLPGPKPSPCITIQWSAGTTMVTVNGTPALVQSSVGTCYSPENAPQGVAIIGNTQQKGEGI